MKRFTFLFAPAAILFAGAFAPAALAQCGGGRSIPAATGRPAHVHGTVEPAIAAPRAAAAVPVNRLCPIRGNEVDPEAPMRTFRGKTIGFCCPGCEGKWDKKTDDERMALLAKNSPEAVAAIEAAAKTTPEATAQNGQPAAANLSDHPAVKVARGYLVACEKADAVALNAVFLDKGRATISENASDEGTWETYRDHHLLPELKEMPGFTMTVSKEDVQTFGAASIVRHIGSFTVPDPDRPDAPRRYLAAVTYIVVDDGGSPKIAHLHWSSRAEKKDAAKPETPKAEHGSGQDGGHNHK